MGSKAVPKPVALGTAKVLNRHLMNDELNQPAWHADIADFPLIKEAFIRLGWDVHLHSDNDRVYLMGTHHDLENIEHSTSLAMIQARSTLAKMRNKGTGRSDMWLGLSAWLREILRLVWDAHDLLT